MTRHLPLSVRVPIETDNPSICRNEETCIKCGMCKEVCTNVIGVLGTYTLEETGGKAICIHCGQCANVCPPASITEVYEYPDVRAAVNDPEEHKKEEQRSRLINIASMRAFERVRQEGNAVLVFPSGTRYRPGYPETKRGVREIDSYIKLSDVVMPVSINGNCLRIPESKHEMTEDVVFHDRLIMTAGNICSAAALREEAKQWAAQAEPDQTDRKQITVDYVMHILENMHTENEKGRLDGLEETPGTAG